MGLSKRYNIIDDIVFDVPVETENETIMRFGNIAEALRCIREGISNETFILCDDQYIQNDSQEQEQSIDDIVGSASAVLRACFEGYELIEAFKTEDILSKALMIYCFSSRGKKKYCTHMILVTDRSFCQIIRLFDEAYYIKGMANGLEIYDSIRIMSEGNLTNE